MRVQRSRTGAFPAQPHPVRGVVVETQDLDPGLDDDQGLLDARPRTHTSPSQTSHQGDSSILGRLLDAGPGEAFLIARERVSELAHPLGETIQDRRKIFRLGT